MKALPVMAIAGSQPCALALLAGLRSAIFSRDEQTIPRPDASGEGVGLASPQHSPRTKIWNLTKHRLLLP